MFSILIPTYNNINYLKICIDSIEKNSRYSHQIIVHVNEGSDGTIDYVKSKKLLHTYSKENIGMPKALNTASQLAQFDYILISHDDFYYCPGWDSLLMNEVKLIDHKYFYLSGTMVGAIDKINLKENVFPPIFNAGTNHEEFDENKLIDNIKKIKIFDFQGTTKCPGLVHKDIWNKVGGWSEEFFPTGGDDSDFAMKLWKNNIRIFKGIGSSLVYHFGSITTRKKGNNLFTYNGSRGNKIFIKKWKMSINFFEKFYLNSGLNENNEFVFNKYNGPLKDPIKSFKYFQNLITDRLKYYYLVIINFK